MADKAAGRLIKDLSDAKRRRVQVMTKRAIDNGWTDNYLAERLEAVVGLDARYAAAVENFRLTMVKNGTPPGRARALSKSYAGRLREHRALVIARTEVHKSLLDAQRLIWKQAQEDGDLTPFAVRVTRVHKDCCKTHCRKFNGRRNSLKKADGGPPFHPQCRCYEELDDQGVVKTVSEIAKRRKSRLDWSEKQNWVENEGGLPRYIEDIAVALIRDRGMTRERAIAVAISRCKMWAAGGGGVNADTRAKAAKAIAQWEKMKASARAKRD